MSASIKKICHALLPAEWMILAAIMVAGLLILWGYPALLPRTEGGEVLKLLGSITNYPLIIFMCILLYISAYLLRCKLRRQAISVIFVKETLTFFRLLICLAAAVYLMLCFKWWAHLNTANYDAEFWRIDNANHGIKHLFFLLQQIAGIPSIYYFQVFAYSFILSYTLAIVINPGIFTQLVTAGIAVMLIGGGCYIFAPAYGPFIFASPSQDILSQTQSVMLTLTKAFKESGGKAFDATRFEAVLGAMPSLHVAHTTVISAYVFKLHRMLGIIFMAVAFYIAIYASVTKFHYLIDLPAGLIVAGISIGITEYAYHLKHAGTRMAGLQRNHFNGSV